MSFIHVVGYVTTELDLKVSHRGTTYVRLALEERLNNGRIQSYQVWAYGWDAEHLVKWGVGAGSILEVNGQLFVEEYTAKDGHTPGIRLKIIYKDGGPVRCANQKPAVKDNPTEPADAAASDGGPRYDRDRLDGEREPLPD